MGYKRLTTQEARRRRLARVKKYRTRPRKVREQ